MPLTRKRCAPVAFTAILLAASLLSLASFGPAVNAAVLYDSGNPTPAEQLVLEYINRARFDPVAEGQRLGIDIHEGLSDPNLVGPRPPLAMNKILLGIAEAHTQNMYNLNYYSHNDPNGDTPFDRMINAGYDYLSAGENMAGGVGVSATFLEDLLMVDAGTAGRLHRVNMLDFFNAYPCGSPPCVYYEVGIGYYQGATPNGLGLSSLMTQDFGTANTGPFLLGVVYNDLNHNNFYDIGEGIAGVSITPSSGSYYAISSSAGGYAIPTGTSGTITITASGPGFGPITQAVTLNGVNVKVDFTTSTQTSTTSTSTQTSSTTTVITTSSTSATSQTQSTTSSQTTTSIGNPPSIVANPLFAPAGSAVNVSGSGFSSGDTSCFLSGSPVSASNCSISGGTLTASFVVANVTAVSYVVLATGSPVGDSASVIFTVTVPMTQTTTSSTSSTLNSTQTTQNTTVSSSTTGSTSSQETTTTSIVTSTQSSTTNTQTATPDFLLSASANAINLAQSSTGDLAISVQSVGSFDQQVQLGASGLPEGVEISFSPNPVSPSEGGSTSSTVTLTVTRSVPTGIYSFTIVAASGSVSKEITLSLRVSGCLIATAAFGSELAPEVQFLRVFRDDKILRTVAGTSFMAAFNTWYYSFSPTVAQYEANNPAMRLIVRLFIYPLIRILQIGSVVFDIFSFNSEAAAVFSGISISALVGAIYLAGPVLILRRAFSARTRRLTRTLGGASLFAFLLGLLTVALAEVFKAETMIAIGSSIVVLSAMAGSALLTSRTIETALQTLRRD